MASDADSGRRGNIFFGIAGWSYPDWEGIVYSGSGRDKLVYAARFVDCIEINSSFYRPPSARTAASWAERTAALPDFFFTAKLPMAITHECDLSPRTATTVREGFSPLVEAGMLRHLLAQFRYDFANCPEHLGYLERIHGAFAPLANVVLELRHKSWEDPGTLERLNSLGVTVANLDYPLARNSFSLRECGVGAHRYLRLHGRNAAAWFSRGAGRDETYNYYYSSDEIKELAGRAGKLAEKAKTLTVIGNNHFQGKEFANVLQLKALVTGNKVSVPPGLLARYPELGGIGRPEDALAAPLRTT